MSFFPETGVCVAWNNEHHVRGKELGCLSAPLDVLQVPVASVWKPAQSVSPRSEREGEWGVGVHSPSSQHSYSTAVSLDFIKNRNLSTQHRFLTLIVRNPVRLESFLAGWASATCGALAQVAGGVRDVRGGAGLLKVHLHQMNHREAWVVCVPEHGYKYSFEFMEHVQRHF